MHFINPLINPSTNDYLTYHINSDYSININPSISNHNTISLSMEDFVIKTDTSLFPWSSMHEDKGMIVYETKS